MSQDVWSEQATNPPAIEAALRDLLRERHAANRALAPARVLNLVVIVDREWKAEISERLERVGRYHASRTILCSVQEGRRSLDAVATIAYEDPADGGISPIRERVDIDLGSEQLERLDTIVNAVLVSELPTMLWAPQGHEAGVLSMLPLTDVILVDSDEDEALHCLGKAAELRDSAYVVDLAWLRTTPWRERLASSFDPPWRREALGQFNRLCVRHRPSSRASAPLLAGWLAARLGWEVAPLEARGDGLAGVATGGDGREVEISLVAVEQDPPGLAGVTIGWDGSSLALDRGPGGLSISYCASETEKQQWQVLGASRGEARILGEGVRQALLRDTTYPPALDRALVLQAGRGDS